MINDLLEIFNFAIFSLKNNHFLRNFASTEKLLFLKILLQIADGVSLFIFNN